MDQLQPASGVNEDSFRESGRSPTMLSKSLEPVRATKVHLYRNGDAFFPSRQVVIRRGDMNLDRVLDYMSGEMKDYGAIRRLYTPRNGTRVTSVSQIQDGSTLVVSKTNKFRKLQYASIMNIRERETQYKATQANRPVKLKSPVKVLPRRFFFGTEKPKNVVFLRNGDRSAKPHRVLLTKRNTISWDQLCQILSDKLKMESGVQKIYTVGGELITGFDQIEDGASYVAVARIKFKNLGYKPAPPMKLGSPRKIALPPISKAKVRIRPRPPAKLPGTSSRKVPARSKPKPTELVSPERQLAPPKEPTPEPPKEPTPEPTPEPTSEPTPEPLKEPSPEPEPEPEQIKLEATVAKIVPPVVKAQSYIVKVWTAEAEGGGTDAKVFMTIYGSKGSSPRLPLSDKAGRFEQGATDLIAVEADPIGDLQRIRIEHDNSGPSSAWKLGKITVRDTVSDKLGYFHCNRWIADDRGDFQTVAELEASDTDMEPEPEREAAPAVEVDETGFAATETRETADDVEDSAETRTDEVEDVDAKAEEVEEVGTLIPEAEVQSPEPESEATFVVEKDDEEAGEEEEIEEIGEAEVAEVAEVDQADVASSDADADAEVADGADDDEADGEVLDASLNSDADEVEDAESDAESVASVADSSDAESIASDVDSVADERDGASAADPSPTTAANGLSDAEEQLRVAITDVQHGDLRSCFSTADDGTPVASLTELANAISNKVPELTTIADLQAAMQGAPGDGDGPTVTGFEEAQLLLASAFYVKRCKEHLEPDPNDEYTLDLEAFRSTVTHFGVFTLSDEIVKDFEGLGKDEAGKVSVLEVGMWLANHRIIPLLS